MLRKPLLALLSLMSLTQGCIIIGDGGPDPVPVDLPDVTFSWYFGGKTCLETPEVETVRIRIPGETLKNNGEYPCRQESFDGITLLDFYDGSYPYTVEAFDQYNELLFSTSGTFVITDGNVIEQVDLIPVGSAPTFAYLSWTLPASSQHANPNCEQAGVTHVDVLFDGEQWVRYACADGLGTRAVRSPYLDAGEHTVYFRATYVNSQTSEDRGYYFKSGALFTEVGRPASNLFNLAWYGGAKLTWEVWDEAGQKSTCAAELLSTVYVNFKRANGSFVYAGSGDARPCTEAVTYYDELEPGTYEVYISARASDGVLYNNNSTVPEFTVVAGVFGEASTVPLKLFLDPR